MDTKKENKLFGLLGKNISYSFSKGYFEKKFETLKLENYDYVNFDISSIEEFSTLWKKHTISGMNVTIPYKEEVISKLDSLDATAADIGAVNTIKRLADGTLRGYNTDCIGFRNSLEPLLNSHHQKALILGTGGASKAVTYVLNQLGIVQQYVSRKKSNTQLTYEELTESILTDHTIIVNCSPLGTFPKLEEKPNIPYEFLTKKHLLFDLIYNPSKTTFLKMGEAKGCQVQNGYDMLVGQAEASWELWRS